MVRCSECRKRIRKNQLSKVFQLTLGKMKDGNFHGNEILYFHIEELMVPNSIKMKY